LIASFEFWKKTRKKHDFADFLDGVEPTFPGVDAIFFNFLFNVVHFGLEMARNTLHLILPL
jgi:hypothetical protein